MILGWGGAMLGGKGQLGAAPSHVEIGIAPAVEFAGSAQCLTRPSGVGVLASVMNQENGQLKVALKLPEVRKQRGDLGSVVFIDPVEADQRIEDQQDWPEIFHGVG